MEPIFLSEPARAHGGDWLKALNEIAGKPDIVGMELGTFMGESAECFLDNVFCHPTARFYCVDIFTGSKEHEIANVDCSKLEEQSRARLARFPQCHIIKGYSHEVLKGFTERLDFCYIDASHTSCDVLRDSVLVFDLMKVGGCICWDDLSWEVFPDPLDCPRMGIEAFLKIYSRKLNVTHLAWQAIATKTSE